MSKGEYMSTYLVTGGAGFIGSHLVDELLRLGHTVKVLDNLSTGRMVNIEQQIDRIEFIQEDIRNLDSCRKACLNVDYVLHQAALGSVPRSIEDPLTSHDVNVTGTVNMLRAASQAAVKRFVFASSSAVYGDHPGLPKVEEKIGQQLSPYAVTKYADELYAGVFLKNYGLQTVGLRYFNVFGPRQDSGSAYAAVIPLFVSALMANKSPRINGDGEQSRDFTYVDNVVQANLLAAVAPKSVAGEVFNVACHDRITVNVLFEKIQALLGSSVAAEYGPERAGDILHSFAAIDKARNLLGYRGDVSFEEGLKRSIEWYQNNLSD
jgi:nucleoside-diphosphate-sugar epimerase